MSNVLAVYKFVNIKVSIILANCNGIKFQQYTGDCKYNYKEVSKNLTIYRCLYFSTASRGAVIGVAGVGVFRGFSVFLKLCFFGAFTFE